MVADGHVAKPQVYAKGGGRQMFFDILGFRCWHVLSTRVKVPFCSLPNKWGTQR